MTRPRTPARAAALVAVAALLAACTSSPGVRSTAAAPSPTPAAADAAARDRAVASLLADRAGAVVHRDATAYASTQVRGARVPAFDRLAVLPVARWSYAVDSVEQAPGAQNPALRVTVSYRLDLDRVDALVHERLTLVRAGAGWKVRTESTDGARKQPWDLGRLTVVRGRSSLVIGIGAVGRSVLRAYATSEDSVVPDVTAVWGRGWACQVVVVVPPTSAILAKALGRASGSLAEVAAVTMAEDGGDRDGPVRGADRVWTNTPLLATLNALGRRIVLRHETTHVATGAASTRSTPLWLEEGIAELVGYRGSGIPTSVALGDLLTAQRGRRAPARLPADADFSGPRAAVAYETAHLACLTLVDEVGIAGLVRIYRLTAAGSGTPEADVEVALREVTGTGVSALDARWVARVRSLAARTTT